MKRLHGDQLVRSSECEEYSQSRINFSPRRAFTGRVNLGGVSRLMPAVSGAWVRSWLDADEAVAGHVDHGRVVGAVGLAERGLPGGGPAPAMSASPGDDDAPGQPGEEQGTPAVDRPSAVSW